MDILTIMVATMISLSNANPAFLTATERGDYYEPVVLTYDAPSNRTYAIFVRYHVWGEKYGTFGSYNKTINHLQVRYVNGRATMEDAKKDARERADKYITIVSK